jgi:hypothetical protein
MEVTIIILQVLVGALGAYILFYAQQKGKNLADKQDLRNITQIVEEIKKNNTAEIELLKNNLDFISSRKLEVFSEEKEALVGFYAQINTWLWEGLNARLNEYNHTNYSDLSDKLVSMRDMYNKTNIAFSKVQLLISENELIMAGHYAIKEVLNLHHFVEGLYFKLKRNLASEKIAIDQLFDKKFDFKSLPKEFQQFQMDQATERNKERVEILETYHSKHSDFFNPALKLVYDFQGLATDYLRS